MARYIDADALIEKLNKNSIFLKITNAEDKNVIEIINEQPTAYDMEAVVAELERFSLDTTPYCNAMDRELCDGMSDCDFCKIQHAIDIVRNAGKDGAE